MKEKLLQFIWQFQYYNRSELRTTSGDTLQILDPGTANKDQGPDFLQAKVMINNTIWAGNIEIHILSTSWYLHHHDRDPSFNNIILHVVWKNDIDVYDNNGIRLPTLVLEDRVSKILLSKYESLMENAGFIACGSQIHQVNELILSSWKERLIIERLQNKSNKILSFQSENKNHWEETFWWILAGNFGIKVNSVAFEQIARSIPLNIISKHRNQLQQIESLLFGQAGLLNSDFTESYPLLLQKEYKFLKKKYGLNEISLPILFLRMRPANFPTIRLAQLAVLITNSHHLFSKIIEEHDIKEIKKLLEVTANDYWHYHYMLDAASEFKKKMLGQQTINNIIINTIVPMVYTYGHFYKNDPLIDKALRWLEQLSPENNSITEGFTKLSLSNKSSYDSQSLIHLKNEYCNSKRCLNCAIGNSLIKSTN